MERRVTAYCAALLLGACAATVPQRPVVDGHGAHVGIPAPSGPAEGSRGAGPTSPPLLEVYVYPHPDANHGGTVEVSITLTAPEAELGAWSVPASLSQPLAVTLHESQAGGANAGDSTQQTPLDAVILRAEPGATLTVPRARSVAKQRTVRLTYTLPIDGLSFKQRWPERDNFFARGRDVLILPQESSETPIDTRLEVNPSGYGPSARSVSSLGLGPSRRLALTRAALANTVMAAGELGSSVFEAPEGHDEAAWFGFSRFDPRQLAAEVASFRSGVRQAFINGQGRPLTLITISEPTRRLFDVARAPASVLIRVPPDAVLAAPLRLSILHQVLKEWIGGQLLLTAPAGEDTVWFTDGLCRFFAREFAFRFGLLTPTEYVDEVNSLLAIQAILGHSTDLGSVCAESATQPPDGSATCALVLEVARGALLATQVDTTLRAKGSSLVNVVAELMKSPEPLTLPAWLAALEQSGGRAFGDMQQAFAKGLPIVLDQQALGPCFAPLRSHFSQSLLGFEYQETAESTHVTVSRLSPVSPAFAAGIRPGMLLQSLSYTPYDATRPIEVQMTDGRPFEYDAATRSVPGIAWKRIPGVRDEQCPPL